LVHCGFGGLLVWLADRLGDDVTRLRVFGGASWVALADVRLGARRSCVRVKISPLGWRLFGWTVSRSLVLVASASVASALLQDGWARLGGQVGRWLGRCLFVRCWWRPMYGVVLLFVQIATAAAAALVCLFVVLFVMIDLFIAALAACLCG
jgi:hypothetical protein